MVSPLLQPPLGIFDLPPGAVVALGALAGIAALTKVCWEITKWFLERRRNEIGQVVGQLDTVLLQVRAENDRLLRLNDDLRTENNRLEALVRSLSQENMDTAHREKVAQDKLEALMEDHHQLLGRLKERGDAA